MARDDRPVDCCPAIPLSVWEAGIKAFERWDPETEEPEAMVASVYWAMCACRDAIGDGQAGRTQ